MVNQFNELNVGSNIVRAYLTSEYTKADADILYSILEKTEMCTLDVRMFSLVLAGIAAKEGFFILLLKKYQDMMKNGRPPAGF